MLNTKVARRGAPGKHSPITLLDPHCRFGSQPCKAPSDLLPTDWCAQRPSPVAHVPYMDRCIIGQERHCFIADKQNTSYGLVATDIILSGLCFRERRLSQAQEMPYCEYYGLGTDVHHRAYTYGAAVRDPWLMAPHFTHNFGLKSPETWLAPLPLSSPKLDLALPWHFDVRWDYDEETGERRMVELEPTPERHQVQSRGQGLHPPSDDFHPPSHAFDLPHQAAQQPRQDWHQPGVGFQPPGQDLQPPGQDLQPPDHDLQLPGQDLQPPGQDLQPPGHDLQPPGQDLQPPGQDLQPPGQDPQPSGHDFHPPSQQVYLQGKQVYLPGQDTRRPGHDYHLPHQDSHPPGQEVQPPLPHEVLGLQGLFGPDVSSLNAHERAFMPLELRAVASQTSDCVVGPWQAWGSCSRTCGGGYRHRSRHVTDRSHSSHFSSCPATYESSSCNTHSCTTCDTVKLVSETTDCITNSGTDTAKQCHCVKNVISAHGSCGDASQAACEAMLRRYKGALPHCDFSDASCTPATNDCVVGPWQAWGSCSRTCGGGYRHRSRHLPDRSHSSDFSSCPATYESSSCNTHSCTTCDTVKLVSETTDCITNSGTDTAKQCQCVKNVISAHDSCGDASQAACEAMLRRYKGALPHCDFSDASCTPATSDCVVGPWQAWGSCSRTCGGGYRHRSRHLPDHSHSSDFSSCPATYESSSCNTHSCTTCDTVKLVSETTDCITNSGTDTAKQCQCVKNVISAHGSCGDASQAACEAMLRRYKGALPHCDFSDASCTPATNGCVVGPWQAWGSCSRTCGGGYRHRSRHLPDHSHSSDFSSCPATYESSSCNTHSCTTCDTVKLVSETTDCITNSGTDTAKQCQCVKNVISAHGSCGDASQAACEAMLRRYKGALPHCDFSDASCTPATNDCVVGPWQAWGSCSRTCGGGYRHRSRHLPDHSHSSDFSSCPATYESSSCNTHSCTTCDTVKLVSETTDCITNSGTDTAKQCQCVKNVISAHGSCGDASQAACEAILRRYKGALPHCDFSDASCTPATNDCVVGPWQAWGSCSRTCGGGYRHRSRHVMDRSNNWRFSSCPATYESSSCNTHSCTPATNDCVVGPWQAWGSCSRTCGGGYRHRSRHVTDMSYNSRYWQCPTTYESSSCNTHSCTTCDTTKAASDYKDCVSNAGTDTAKQCQCVKGFVSAHGSCGQDACEKILGRYKGALPHCDFSDASCTPATNDCVVGPWQAWGSCSRTCGGGYRHRSRHLPDRSHSSDFSSCPATYESSSCNTHSCTTCDTVKLVSETTDCITNSGTDTAKQCQCVKNVISAHGSCGDASQAACEAMLRRYKGALPHCDFSDASCTPATSNCVVGPWQAWGSCSRTCGGGYRHRSRHLPDMSYNSRYWQCPTTYESSSCNTHSCTTCDTTRIASDYKDCVSNAGTDTAKQCQCVKGFVSAHGSCGQDACEKILGRYKGALPHCDFSDASCTPATNGCVVGPWQAWGSCSRTCGGGYRHRSRHLPDRSHSSDFSSCPATYESSSCNTHSCTTCDTVKLVSETTDCITNSGTDTAKQCQCVKNVISAHGSCGDASQAACEAMLRRYKGALPHCDFSDASCTPATSNCVVGPWQAWGSCSRTCGGGYRHRSRHVMDRSNNWRFSSCPATYESSSCNTHSCTPATNDCVVGPWQAWGSCSRTCGGGYRHRSRHVTDMSYNSRYWQCPTTYESSSCNTHSCTTCDTTKIASDYTSCFSNAGTNTAKQCQCVKGFVSAYGQCNVAACEQFFDTFKPAYPDCDWSDASCTTVHVSPKPVDPSGTSMSASMS